MTETATTLEQQLAEAKAKRAVAIAGAKEADQVQSKASRMFDDDRAKEAKARADQYDRERERQNEVIHQLECQIESARQAACAEEIAEPAVELRRLMRQTADQAQTCYVIAKKYGQSTTTFALPPLPEEGADGPRIFAENLFHAALKIAQPSYGTGHPDHPSYIR